MKGYAQLWILLSLLILLISNCSGTSNNNITLQQLWQVKNIEELDQISSFTFAIFSDNKGDAPTDSPHMAGTVDGIQDMNAQFIIGLGDHVKMGWDNHFLEYIENKALWMDHFYPVIADGENEYYGEGQGDWGAGGSFLDVFSVCEREHVECRDNHTEYYAAIPVKGYTVHFISLHYPDTGEDPFREDSKDYLIQKLSEIESTPKDIVIAAAHSATGFWLPQLSSQEQDKVLSQCDVLLGATIHIYARQFFDEGQAVYFNTGSSGYSRENADNYMQVNVIKDLEAMVIHNFEDTLPRILQSNDHCTLKFINGQAMECQFVH